MRVASDKGGEANRAYTVTARPGGKGYSIAVTVFAPDETGAGMWMWGALECWNRDPMEYKISVRESHHD